MRKILIYETSIHFIDTFRFLADEFNSVYAQLKNQSVNYKHNKRKFADDCVYDTQQHLINGLLKDLPFETNGPDYLRSLVVQDAIYESAKKMQLLRLYEISDLATQRFEVKCKELGNFNSQYKRREQSCVWIEKTDRKSLRLTNR